MRITVLGATGGIGRAVTDELVSRGHDVVAVNRSGNGDIPGVVDHRAADLHDRAATTQAVAGSDVVVLAAQPPYPQWVDQWPTMLDHALAATGAAGARLVFTDNLYAYAPADAPLTEDSPEHATDMKGALRRRLGRRLLDAHRSGQIRAAIGRFSDYYGPRGINGTPYILGIDAGLRGRKMRGLVDLDQPHTYHYLPDAARGFATLVEHPGADGRVWMLPAAAPITQRTLLGLVNDHLDVPVRIGVVSPLMLRLAGLRDPMVRETRSVTAQFDRPWVVDATRFVDAFGAVGVTPHQQAVAETVAWFRAQAPAPSHV